MGLYDLCYCCIISVSQDTAIRLVTVPVNDDVILEYQFPEFFDFHDHKDNSIYQANATEEIFINNDNPGIIPYIRDSVFEIVIPVKMLDVIFAYICMGSNDSEVPSIDLNHFDSIFLNYSYLINEISKEKILNKNILKYVVLLDKFNNMNDQYMVRHSYNVALWSIEIASEMGFSDRKIRNIYLAALMHDIGNMHVDVEILNKEGKYTEEEYEEVKKHVDYGYNICKDLFLGYNDKMSLWIKQHHEKWNGTGYPQRLSGEDISIEARILKIADSLDGMLSWRSYKTKMNFKQVISELRRCSGKDFDPNIVDAAIIAIRKRLDIKLNIIDEFIMPANLIITTKDDIFSIDGHISKANDELVFMASSYKGNLNYEYVTILLSIEKFNVINEYKVSIKRVESGIFISIKFLKKSKINPLV